MRDRCRRSCLIVARIDRKGRYLTEHCRQQLVDNVRRELLSGEICLQEYIELQSSMAEFSISLPLPSVLDDDSENEDMGERRRDVLAKEYEDSKKTEASSVWDLLRNDRSGSLQARATIASSSKDMAVDMEGSDAEEKDDDSSNDHVPKLVTRDMVVALWKKTTFDVRAGFILRMDKVGLPGAAILAFCLGVEELSDEMVWFPLSGFYKV